MNALIGFNRSIPLVRVKFEQTIITMVKPIFNATAKRVSRGRAPLVIPEKYANTSIVHQNPGRTNGATMRIMSNFYNLTYDATQKEQGNRISPKRIETCDKTTDTKDLPEKTVIIEELNPPKEPKRSKESKGDSKLYIRVKRSLLKKMFKQIQEQSNLLKKLGYDK